MDTNFTMKCHLNRWVEDYTKTKLLGSLEKKKLLLPQGIKKCKDVLPLLVGP